MTLLSNDKKASLRRAVSCATLLLFAATTATAADRVRLLKGGSVTGSLVETSTRGVTLDSDGRKKSIQVTEIKAVLFDNEPPQLTQARINFASNGYETALEKLGEVSPRAIDRDIVRQEVTFYTAMCDARLALAGARDAGKAAAMLTAFVKANRDSFHFYEAVETLGLLASSLDRPKRAEQMFGLIAKAPFASLKMRAGVLVGQSLQAQGKHAEALKRFDAVLAIESNERGAAAERTAATLGKATSLAARGQLDAGLRLVRSVLLDLNEDDADESNADETDESTQATAYNALGRCYEAADRPKDALFAYLHTDLLFSGNPETHAEALGRLIELWRTAGKPEAARDAERRLRQNYAASPAARRTG